MTAPRAHRSPSRPLRARSFALRLLLACLLLASPAARAAGAPVRVLLDEALERVDVVVDGAHRVATARGETDTDTGLSWPLAFRDGALASGELDVGPWLVLTPRDGTIRFGGRTYRGSLRIEAAADGLRVVNVVDLEAYLRGVVPAEMQAAWPLEALKAQAVAARSYVLASLDPARPWDICASTECQVYGGMDAEHPRSDLAVRETEGIVISHAGAPAVAYYHADSGGSVASAAEVWGRDLPYLQPRTDVAAASPHRGWTARLSPAAVAAALAAEGAPALEPTSLRILAYTPSGRAQRAEFAGPGGRVVLEGPRLTRVLRGAGLKSTRISVVGALSVRGDGWGHGVGMSQYGARALAVQGYEYGRILAFYYPGVGLQKRIYRAGD